MKRQPPFESAEFFRTTDALRAELQRLRDLQLELAQRLADEQAGSRSERELRLAALNLMEDAVQAHLAAQRENTERRRVEEELRDANRRKDEFLAVLAHELRNPLAPIRNSVQILRMSGSDPAAARQVCEMLDRQVNHMVRLVDDLLEVSRITRGKIKLYKSPINLSQVVHNAVEISQPLVTAARHELHIELPDEPLVVDADSVRLAQVFANLLNNAVRYTPEGGQIWLKS